MTGDSPRFRTMALGSVRVSDARFPPGFALAPHTHEDPIFAVFIDGSMDVDFGTRRYECTPATVQIHPVGARHSQRYHRAGARIIVLEPILERFEAVRPLRDLLGRVEHFRSEPIARTGRRLVRELARRDSLTRLSVEALALELLATAGRVAEASRRSAPPVWLLRAEELVQDHLLERLRIAEIAAAVDVHPATLARAFREHRGASLGCYLRRLRLDWAADRLRTGDRPIAAIAIRAGFFDQSHFTRAFKAHTGCTPAAYRRERSR